MKLLRVDMKNENTVATDLPKEWLAIGGSGLIAKIMNDEVPPGTDPLGPDNKLIGIVQKCLHGDSLADIISMSK